MPNRYKLISADSHLDLSPNRWTHRVPTKWRDRAPRCVRLDSGEDAVIMENRPLARIGLTRSVGVSPQELHLQVPKFEESAGTGSADKRLQEQNQDGMQAEIMFSRIGIIRGIREDDGYVAMNHAYNEFLAEEYCATAPDRLMAMGVIPTTNIDDAVGELEYCARAGLKGVQLEMFPNGKGHPTPEDDRFWSAALELRMPVTSHSNGGSTRFSRQGPVFQYPKRAGAVIPSASSSSASVETRVSPRFRWRLPVYLNVFRIFEFTGRRHRLVACPLPCGKSMTTMSATVT